MKAAATESTLYPCFYYDDAVAAIEWLAKAFGFRRRLVVPGPEGSVLHAELTFGPAVIMLSTSRPEMGWVSPRQLTGINCAVSIHVDDPDGLYQRAQAADAEVLREIQDEPYGGRGFMVADPEGNKWYFGSYRPGAHWNE